MGETGRPPDSPETGWAARYVASARKAVAAERSSEADAQLGLVLTFVAGAINAGGFLAVGQYTSHMSGILSAMADNLALGALGLSGAGLLALLAFTAGAACSAILINWGRRRDLGEFYALPLGLEAALLFGFGLLGSVAQGAPSFTPAAILLLCFIMGLQNATITKISGARIRTTHVTGIVTDIGIELGKLVYWNRDLSRPEAFVRADRPKLRLLAGLLASFFVGGVAGAIAFSSWGYAACIPLALALLVLAGPSFVSGLGTKRRYPL